MILGQALSYKTKQFQKDNTSLRSSISFAEAKHIGIIFSNDEPEKVLMAEKLSSIYRKEGKQIKVIVYDRNVQIKHLPFESFSKKDVTFWGKFLNESINQFSQISFDFLICLDEHPGVIIQNILAKSKAKCRVGVWNNLELENKMFELIIQTSKETNLVDNIYSYTKNIR